MHELDTEPARVTDPGRLGFERDWDDLTDAGVRLPSEQRMLWQEVVGEGEEILCITPRTIELPTGYRMSNEPLITWDVEANSERKIWYPHIILVRDDPALWESMSDYRAAKRFPSLPGVSMEDDPWFDREPYPEPFRIWDLWPVHGLVRSDVENVLMNYVMDNDGWRAIEEVLDADRGERDICEIAEYHGHGEPLTHVHKGYDGEVIAPEEQDSSSYYECVTGHQALVELIEEVTIKIDGGIYFRFPGDPEIPPELLDAWHGLLESSRRNSSAAIGAFPPWERDEVLIIERAYNQWLWSY